MVRSFWAGCWHHKETHYKLFQDQDRDICYVYIYIYVIGTDIQIYVHISKLYIEYICKYCVHNYETNVCCMYISIIFIYPYVPAVRAVIGRSGCDESGKTCKVHWGTKQDCKISNCHQFRKVCKAYYINKVCK